MNPLNKNNLNKLLVYILKRQVAKLQSQYRQIHEQSMPITVVTGTVGKSSVTMLISELFENNDYKVITGTSQTKNLNSLTGLCMALGGFYVEMSEGIKALQFAKLIFKGFLSTLLPNHNLSKVTAIVAEIGYDYQGESEQYLKIFENIDMLVVSSCTWEHNQGFDAAVDKDRVAKIIQDLPETWQGYLNNGLIDGRLRNIAIEQLNLIQRAEHFVLPEQIGEISNTIITNAVNDEQMIEKIQNANFIDVLQGKPKFFTATATPSRVNGILMANKYIYNSKYLLPPTFARTSLILESIANVFEFDLSTVKTTLNECELPFGRFGQLIGKNSTRIIDSTYNSDPASLNYFLDTLEEVINNPTEFGQSSGHTLILGEMRELGDTAIEEHRKVLDRILKLQENYGKQILEVLFIGKEWLKLGQEGTTARYIRYWNNLFMNFESSSKICEYLDTKPMLENSWYWLKGSQNTIFLEVVTKHLLQDPNDSQYLCRQELKWDKLRN
jgi:hypothetical protein